MNKEQLIEAVQAKVGSEYTKKHVQEGVEAVFDAITSSLSKGEDVAITGFGTFKVRNCRSRRARNPRSNTEVQVPARRKAVFKVSPELNNLLK